MIEDELRASFARHEAEAPSVSVLRQGIARLNARRRRRRIAIRSTGVAAVVAVVLLATPLIMRTVSPRQLPFQPGPSGASDGPLNVLVLGLDPYAPAQGQKPTADSVTLVHINADHSRVHLVDFERDVLVDIPGHGKGKIGSAYALGGAPLTVQIVQSLTGITVNGMVVLTLDALRDLTNAVGGVPLCLPVQVVSVYTGQTYPVGCYELDGAAVADLVRQRVNLPLGGYSRDSNIQLVLRALAKRVHGLNLLTDATRLAGLLHAGGSGLQIDFGVSKITDLAALLVNIDGDDVVGIVSPQFETAPTTGGVSYEQLDPVVTPELFAALRNDTLDQFATAHPTWTIP